MATTTRRAGRHSKGERRLIGFRLATRKADIVREVAEAEGYEYVSDWVAHVVEERLNNTDLSKIKIQEELPLGQLAS